MVPIDAARGFAMSLPEVVERDHFGSPSFRVGGRIFAQLSKEGTEPARALVKLAVADSEALMMSRPDIFSAVPQWGRHGWTHVSLATVEESMLRDLLLQSWRMVAPKRLAAELDGRKAAKSRKSH